MSGTPKSDGGPPARFVVGTGRCGSTLLTRMLDQHRCVLGLNEVFTGLDWGRRFTTEPVDGAWVADLLTTPNHVIDTVVGRGHRPEEVTYPFGDPAARHRPGDDVPWLAVSTLGYLTDDVDGLLDDVVDFLSERPVRPIEDHYSALFRWLCLRSGATDWVERSGSSIDYVGGLLSLFPRARVVDLVRDGREVVLSMRNHAAYRMAVQLLYDVVPEGVDPEDPDALVDGWLDGDPPVELYGRYWSEQLAAGLPVLDGVHPSCLLNVRFEELVADPRGTIADIGRFLALPDDPGFVDRAAALVRGVPPTRAGDLDAPTRAALDQACAPGFLLLADHDAA